MESLRVIHLLSMKTLKIILILLLMVGIGSGAAAQTTREAKKAARQAAIKKSIDDKSYTFIANQATPLGGGPIVLSGIYDLRVKSDSVISFLPYYGRAYFDVGYNPTDAGMKFTSTKFSYQTAERKNGGWMITIKPTDAKYIQSLILYISANGYASLTINCVNRDAINYDGYFE